MDIIFYSVSDGDNVINKSLVDGFNININLKNVSDVTRLDLTLLESETFKLSDYNYCHVPLLERYYFVDSMQRVNNKMVAVNLDCDVLDTYKSEILNSVSRFKRNIKQGDYYETSLEVSTIKQVSKHFSNVTLPNIKTLILTTIGY